MALINRKTALASARADGHAEGVKLERARLSEILGCEEADGRKSLATHIAFKTDMSVADARVALATAAKEAPARPASPFATALPEGVETAEEITASLANLGAIARAAGVKGF